MTAPMRPRDRKPLGLSPDGDQDLQRLVVRNGPGGNHRRIVAEAVARGGRGSNSTCRERASGENRDQVHARLRGQVLVQRLLRPFEEDPLEIPPAALRGAAQEVARLPIRLDEVLADPDGLGKLAGEEEGGGGGFGHATPGGAAVTRRSVLAGRLPARGSARRQAIARSARAARRAPRSASGVGVQKKDLGIDILQYAWSKDQAQFPGLQVLLDHTSSAT